MNIYLVILLLCYFTIVTIWIATAFSNKPTKRRIGGWGFRISAILIIIFFIYIQRFAFFGQELLPNTIIIKLISDILTILGTVLMIWARVTLGKNWSADITLKENHQIITSGPYSFMRHPIYSGIILIVLGLTFYINNISFTIFFLIFLFGAYFKAQKEEKLLINHFPVEYAEYKKHTRALIPFIF